MVAVLKWREVSGNPALGIVLLVLAVVLVAAVGLVRRLWQAKYDARVIDWVSAGLDRRLSRFAKRYRDYLLSDLRFVDLKGLAGRTYDPELSDVYVDVALQPRDPGRVPSSDLPAAETADLPAPGQRRLISDFLGRPQPRILAVIGAPGSGKTTLLRHTAREMCTRRYVPRHRRGTPVLLALRDHLNAIAADPQVALPVLVAGVLARYGLAEPRDWLERQLRAGKCLVMLDGLDEVAREEDRKAVSDWVTVQFTRYPGNDFVVTSRPLGYQSAPIEGAITVQTQPFTPEQVNQFVHAWYLAENRLSTRADDPGIARQATVEADDLLIRLRRSPALHALTVNPLLLTMIAIVHRHHGALPGSRADLYAQICQVLLWRRQDVKKLRIEPRGDQKERLMRVLAYEMMLRKVRDLTTDEAITILRPSLRRISKDLTAREFLEDAALNGLFIERETGVRAFAHPTFQEYLAAAHIKDKNLQTTLIDAVSDIWWQETILLYVAGTDAGPIVKACLNANTLPALTLALTCGEEAAELAEDLRDKLEDLLAAGFAPGTDPERRKLMIGVTVARYLRDVITTTSGTRLCRQAITARVYRFFLEDMAERGQHLLPDTPAVQLADPNNIVTGVRGKDAVAFVDWANEITQGRRTFRLPFLAEIQDPAVNDGLNGPLDPTRHSIWLTPDDSEALPRLFTPSNASHPWTITGTMVRDHVTEDFRRAPHALGLLPLMIPARIAVLILNIHGLDFESAVDLAAALDLATAFALEQARVHEPALMAALDLASALDHAREHDSRQALNRALARDLNRDHDLNHDLATALDLASALTAALGHDSSSALTTAVNNARNHVHDLSRDLTSNHASNLLYDLTNALVDSTGAEIFLGCALSQMVTTVRNIQQSENDSSHLIVDILAKTFSVNVNDESEYLVSPDLLADTAFNAAAGLKVRLTDSDQPSAYWARQATDRFEYLANSVFARKQPVTSQLAGALRILALCLAAEADALHETDLGEDLRKVAATVTWLERRNAGDEQSNETIVLALSGK